MNPKIDRILRRQFQHLSDTEFVTVVIEASNFGGLLKRIEEISANNPIEYESAPLLGFLLISATKAVVEEIATEESVISVIPTMEVTISD